MSKPRPFKLKPPKASENDVEAGCLALLNVRGYYAIRLQTGLFRTMDGRRVVTVGVKGLPDYGVLHARHPGFLLETKSQIGKLADAQELKIWEIKMGYKIAVCKASSVEELSQWLNRHEADHGFQVSAIGQLTFGEREKR